MRVITPFEPENNKAPKDVNNFCVLNFIDLAGVLGLN